jgi:hypothetical protein
MDIVSSAQGFTLVFHTAEDLAETIDDLTTLAKLPRSVPDWKPPYLYCVFDMRLPKEELEGWTDDLKDMFAHGSVAKVGPPCTSCDGAGVHPLHNALDGTCPACQGGGDAST